MDDSLSPSKVIALFPFAVKGSRPPARQGDICRGLACFLERRLSDVPGVGVALQHIFVAPESDPGRRGWLMTDRLWSLPQALSLPFAASPPPTHLIQGQALWTDDVIELRMELIDLVEGESLFRCIATGLPNQAIGRFFEGWRLLAAQLLGEGPARLVSTRPTESPEAFEAYLLALAAAQAHAVGLGGLDAVFTHLNAALGHDGHFHEACRMLERQASRALAAGEEAAALALTALEAAATAAPEWGRFQALLGVSLAEQGDGDRAVPLLLSFLEQEPSGALASHALLELARLHLARGERGDARLLLQRALTADAANVEAWEGLAELHHARGNEAEAEECWRRALQEDPDRPETLSRFARLYSGRGDWRRALYLLERANVLDEEDLTLRPPYVEALLRMRETDLADIAATEWVEADGENWRAWLAAARTRRLTRQPGPARYCLERAESLAPTEADRADVALERFALDAPGEHEKFRRLESVHPTAKFTAEERRRYAAAAVQVLEGITAQHRGVAAVWRMLSMKRQALGDSAGAAQAQGELCGLLPSDAEARNTHGALLGEAGLHEDAERAFVGALVLEPGRALFHINHAYALLELGRFGDAEASARRAQALDPTDAAAAKALRTIDKRRAAPKPEAHAEPAPPAPTGGFMQRLARLLGRR